MFEGIDLYVDKECLANTTEVLSNKYGQTNMSIKDQKEHNCQVSCLMVEEHVSAFTKVQDKYMYHNMFDVDYFKACSCYINLTSTYRFINSCLLNGVLF
jgi:hypothetical protein